MTVHVIVIITKLLDDVAIIAIGNTFHQFYRLRLHFLHLMVYEEYTVDKHHYPVLLLHGWPGSVREFYPLIHKLHQTKKDKNNKYIFNVVVPSLPGYAWSQVSFVEDNMFMFIVQKFIQNFRKCSHLKFCEPHA